MSKYCVNCGALLDEEDVFCGDCGANQADDTVDQVSEDLIVVEENEYEEEDLTTKKTASTKKHHSKPIVLKSKNKAVAGILAILLGWIGAHWFYLNKPVRAIIYLAVYMIFPYIWILYIVEGIYFLCTTNIKFDEYRGKGNIIW